MEAKTKRKITEYPVETCIRWYDHFKSLERSDGKNLYYARNPEDKPQDFKYTQEEARFIENEKYICSISFVYWFYRYFFIKDASNKIRRPEILAAQRIFLDILADLDLRRLPIKILNLKARQLGMSTLVEAIILWIAVFIKGSHCVVSSAQDDKTEKMCGMIWLGLEMMPLWMQPKLTRNNVKQGPAFGEINSDILLQHDPRGDTPVAAHMSECPYLVDPEETIEASLLNAMHENKRTFVVLEGTARRKGDWWHNRWLKEREGEKDGRNDFTCLFLPWYVGHDKYPTLDWLRNHPIPENWKPLKETIKQAADANLYVATTPLLRKHMGANWKMPLEQMWCWEHRYNIAKRKDSSYKKFLAEFASDERSCFQSKRWSVFSQAELEEIAKSKADKIQFYAFAGDGIDHRFHLTDYQSHSLPRIDIQWMSMDDRVWNWKLIPLRERPKEKNLDFYLQICEHPKPGYTYVIGIDVGSGIGQNRTVYFVNKVGKGDEPDKPVALLCTANMLSPETPGFANCLGAYYGQFMPEREAKIAPEVQISVGDFISDQLAAVGYVNLYYMDRFDIRRPPGWKPQRRGWVTTGWSRQYMMENLEHAVKTGWLEASFQEFIDELENTEGEESESGKMKYDHASGENNDIYCAAGIAYTVSHAHEAIIARIKGNLKPKKKEEKTEDKTEKDSGATLLARRFQMEDHSKFPNAGDESEGDPLSYVY